MENNFKVGDVVHHRTSENITGIVVATTGDTYTILYSIRLLGRVAEVRTWFYIKKEWEKVCSK